MRKYKVLKNWDTNQYFSSQSKTKWTKDLGLALLFESEEDIDIFFTNTSVKEYFETVALIIVETIYRND